MAFTALGYPDPRNNGDGTRHKSLDRQIKGYKNRDPGI